MRIAWTKRSPDDASTTHRRRRMGDFHEEEQALEKEALEAILMDDLTVLSEAVPRQYCVRVVPFQNGEGENHVGVKATFSIPPTYPDVPAEINVEAEKGLSSAQCSELTAYAEAKALENVGMAMVYLLVDAVREWLADHNIAGQDGSMHAEMLKRMHLKEKEKQRETEVAAANARAVAAASGQDEEDELNRQKRLEGTAVTPESFVEWRDKFGAEMAAKKDSVAVRAAAAAAAVAALKPTGKEMFVQRLAGTEEADEEAAPYDEEEEAAKRDVTINDALFAGGSEDEEDDSDFLPSSDDDDDEEDDSDFDDDEDESDDGSGGRGKKKGGGKQGGRR